MRKNGLLITYRDAVNSILNNLGAVLFSFPVGELLCIIFQGETLDNISRIVRNCINFCPFGDQPLSQDSIEEIERYVLDVIGYEDYFPAKRIAQGSFIRVIEDYRSLSHSDQERLLSEERARAADCEGLFTNIGFDTVGNFLRLCFNNYLIDLSEGIRIFHLVAAEKAAVIIKEEKEEYAELCSALQFGNPVPEIEMKTAFDAGIGEFSNTFIINSFQALSLFEFSHIGDLKLKIRKCANPECNRFFIAQRSSAQYCTNSSPQNPDQTCREFFPQYMSRIKTNENKLDKLEKNALSRLGMDKNRHPEFESEINRIIGSLRNQSPQMKQQVLNGEMTITQYAEWLGEFKRKKEDFDV